MFGALSVSGCYTPQQQQGTLVGGALGAGGGALIGSALTGGSAGGAIAGGIIGAGTGALIGNSVTAPRTGIARVGAGTTATAIAAPGIDQVTLRAPWLEFSPWRGLSQSPRAAPAAGMMIEPSPDSPLVARFVPSPNYGERRRLRRPELPYPALYGHADRRGRVKDADRSRLRSVCALFGLGRRPIDQLVAESDRAWHAGRGSWKAETDLNSASIGIEIVNPGHDGGSPPFPDRQIEATIALAKDICMRWAIAPERVLAHSDMRRRASAIRGKLFPGTRFGGAELAIGPSPRR